MIRKITALVLTVACLLCCFAGCSGTLTEIKDSVLAAAKTELENQIKAKIAENKVEVLETKTAFGKLNDDGKYQFFCAMLIQTNSEENASDCARTLGGLFGETSYQPQTGSAVEHEYLVYKTVTYSRTDFSEGNYYTIYVYVEDMTQVVDVSKLTAEK